jgi:DNA-binding transcriptional LysR family regulator
LSQFDPVTARLILALARAGSIARAAQQENIAPSAVSRRLAELEARTGTVLFDRSAQGVRLTDAGKVYVEASRAMLRRIAELDVRLSDFAKGKAGSLRLACTSSALSGRLPELLADYAAAHPGVRLGIREMSGAEALAALSDADVDLAVVTDNHDFAGFETQPFQEDAVWIIASPEHPLAPRLAKKTPLPFAEVVGYEIVGFHHSGALDRLLRQAADRAGRVIGERVNVESISALVRMVEAGFGIGFLRSTSLHLLAGTDLLGVALDEDWARRMMMIAMRRNAPISAAARAFLDLARI